MRMNPVDAIRDAFQGVADELHAQFHRGPGCYVDIPGQGVVVRVRWAVERIQGVFVTLFRGHAGEETPVREYGLAYLVEFKNRFAPSSDDVECAKGDDPVALAELTRKYALDYLMGKPLDFSEFEEYAARRIAENAPATPTIRGTKFVRPEWTS